MSSSFVPYLAFWLTSAVTRVVDSLQVPGTSTRYKYHGTGLLNTKDSIGKFFFGFVNDYGTVASYLYEQSRQSPARGSQKIP